MKAKNPFSNACGLCEAMAFSNYLTQEQYNSKTAAGRVIADIGGVAGVLGLAAGVASTIQNNQLNRTLSQGATGQISPEQQAAIERERERQRREAELQRQQQEQQRRQQNMIYIGIGLVVLFALFFLLKKKPSPAA